MLHRAGNRGIVFRASQSERGVHPEFLQALPHDVFEQLPGSLAANRIGVENPYGGSADGPRLKDRPALLKDVDDGFQLIFGYRERSALDRGDTLARQGERGPLWVTAASQTWPPIRIRNLSSP